MRIKVHDDLNIVRALFLNRKGAKDAKKNKAKSWPDPVNSSAFFALFVAFVVKPGFSPKL